MDAIATWCGVGLLAILFWYAWVFLNWVWLKPKRIERFLREQGLNGSSYKLFYGDTKEVVEMMCGARCKPPMNLTDDVVSRILPFHCKSVSTYGKTFFTWKGPIVQVHIADPAMVKEVLINYNKFQKPRSNPYVKLIQTGLADTEGDRWAKHRKIINPAFHVEKLKVINKWEEMVPTDTSCEVDVFPYLQTLSRDVISRTAFSSNFEEGKRLFEMLKELAELVVGTFQSIEIPGLSYLPTQRNKKIKEIDKQVKALIRSMIDKRMMALKAGESINEDLLSILLDSNNKEIKQNGKANLGLSINDIIEECKLFYFGGQETTANLLVWSMILLAQHTNWQIRARDEVSVILGKKKPDFEDLSRLKILNMIVNEVLRLYPLVTVLGRIVHEETRLGEITLPPGSILQLHIMLLHHDCGIWGDDVNEFNPERFSKGIANATKGYPSAYIPFSGGPRICIGQNFAIVEAKMALAMILQSFSFELSPSYAHAPVSFATLQPQFGAHLKLCKL